MSRLLVTGGSGFIGTNLLQRTAHRWSAVCNVDMKPPPVETGVAHIDVDILDERRLRRVVQDFAPTHVAHLAARVDVDGTALEGYRVNTAGTATLISAVRATPGVRRLLVVSTQFVCGPDHWPGHDEDFAPHTVYGQSKVVAERLTREADLACGWVIVRPTNVWGPWHPRYPQEFWRVVERGLYLHPGRQPVTRSYGYVGNVVEQMHALLTAPADAVAGRVFYVGDVPINLYTWANGFSRRLTGRDVRVIPRPVVRAMGLLGDVVSRAGVRAPITSRRYRSMTEDYPTPMQPTFDLLGPPEISLDEGIDETVAWLRRRGGQ